MANWVVVVLGTVYAYVFGKRAAKGRFVDAREEQMIARAPLQVTFAGLFWELVQSICRPDAQDTPPTTPSKRGAVAFQDIHDSGFRESESDGESRSCHCVKTRIIGT